MESSRFSAARCTSRDDRRALTKGYAHLTLLAESNEGYANLIKLASAGFLEGYYYKPRVDWELLAAHSAGLIALSGCLSGRVCKALENGNRDEAESGADPPARHLRRGTPPTSRSRTPGLEVQPRINATLAELAAATGLPLVATGDVHYLRHEDARVPRGASLHPVRRLARQPRPLALRHRPVLLQDPRGDGSRTSPTIPRRSRRTLEIAERCKVTMELGRILLPTYPTPNGRDAFDYLVELCEKGLQKRYERVTPELQERLKFELKTIKEMGFADYFLIVWDFISFAKRNGIGVGPGRGSAAG